MLLQPMALTPTYGDKKKTWDVSSHFFSLRLREHKLWGKTGSRTGNQTKYGLLDTHKMMLWRNKGAIHIQDGSFGIRKYA